MQSVGVAAAFAACFLAVGVSVAQRPALTLAAVGGAAAAALVFLRPRACLIALLSALVADGRAVSHLQVGPVYLAEAALAGLGIGALVLRTPKGSRTLTSSAAVLLALSAASLVLHTHLTGLTWARNFAIVYYALFAILTERLIQDVRLLRDLARAVFVGATFAMILVFTGHSGPAQDVVTSTGAVRIAHTSYITPFGIVPLLIAAGVQSGVMKRAWLFACLPFLAGLVLMNYRSSWIAFVAALAAIFARRPTKLLVWSVAIVVVVGAVATLGAGPLQKTSALGKETARIRTIADSNDPNARYRIEYWQRLLVPALRNPIIGHGFGAYDPRLIPPRQTCRTGAGKCTDPHNSFIAIAYRAGLLAAGSLIVLLGVLVIRGIRVARASDGWRRASTSALTAAVVYLGLFAAFNVGLELPYFAVVFWSAVGLLVAVTSNRLWDGEGADV
jgi:hypothetical protein